MRHVIDSPRAADVQHLGEPLRHHVAVALERVDGAVGQHALHAGGDRRRAAVQALQELDVGDGDDLRVAAVTHHADRTVDQLELVEHLDQQPPRDRVAAARAQVVLGALQQVGRERRDLARAREVDWGSLVIGPLLRSRRGCARG